MKLRELAEKRAKVLQDMKDLAASLEKENRSFTESETEQRKKMEAEFASLTDRIEAEKKRAEAEELVKRDQEFIDAQKRELVAAQPALKPVMAEKDDTEKRYTDIFEQKIIRRASLTPEEEKVVAQYRGTSIQIGTTDGLGGFVLPPLHARAIEAAILTAGPFPQAANYIVTSATGVFSFPTIDDTAELAQRPGEASQIAIQDFTFTNVDLGAYPYTSLAVASWRMAEDTAFDFGSWLFTALGERIGRAINNDVLAGDGTNKATGMISALSGSALAAGAAGALAADDVVGLYFSIDAAYRNSPGAAWVMNSATLASLVSVQLAQSNDQLLYTPSPSAGEPATLMGRPVYVADSAGMGGVATGEMSIIFGDLKRGYVVRRAGGMVLQRLVERYADQGSIGFIVHTHFDGKVLQAKAVNGLLHP